MVKYSFSSTGFSEFNERFYWTFNVGPAGGIFRVMDIMLSVAKNAVDKDIAIKIAISHNDQDRPSLSEDYSVVGPIIHCLPHWLQFRKPVALSFGCNLHVAAPEASPNLCVLYRYLVQLHVLYRYLVQLVQLCCTGISFN